jgi:SAM-dependent methyltransferase
MTSSSDRFSDEETLRFYMREAATYATSGKKGPHSRLAAFMQALPEGAHVLELGCGSGRDAEAMVACGLDVDPTDGTPAMAAEAENRLRRRVRILRFDQLADIGRYDGIWANASLLHVPRDGLDAILARVFRALKPGGLHAATFKSGDNRGGRDSFGRYYNYPDRAGLTDAYSRAGPWASVSLAQYEGGGYDGVKTPWLSVTARR